MNFQRSLVEGFKEAVIGIIGAILISAILTGFAEEGLIPSYLVISFTIVGFLGSIALFFYFRKAGFIFTGGWIIGALMLEDLLGFADFIAYLVVPIAAFVIGVVMSVRASNN